MKICILAESLLEHKNNDINGSLIQYYLIAEFLNKHEADVYYLAPDTTSTNPFNSGIKVHHYRKYRYLYNLLSISSIWNQLNKINAQIIYVRGRNIHTFISALWCKKNNCKFIWASNGDDSIQRWKYTKKTLKCNKNRLIKMFQLPFTGLIDILIHYGMNRATIYLNQNTFQKNELWMRLKKKGIIVPSLFIQGEKPKHQIKKQILWIGRISPEKQPQLFLRLAEQFLNTKEWNFVIAGDTNNCVYKSEFLKQLLKLPNVKYLGFIPFLKSTRTIAESSFIVNTSTHEGLSNTFIQAWISATPVLSLNADPNNWIANEKIGCYANGDFNKLEKYCKNWINNPAELRKVSELCKAFSKRYFLNDALSNQYKSIFLA